MWHGLAALTTALAGFGLTWLAQASILLALGLLAGRAFRKAAPAVQSGVYRTTLAAVLVCPVASAALTALGFDGFSLRLPAPVNVARTEPGPPAAQTQIVLTAPVVPFNPVESPELRSPAQGREAPSAVLPRTEPKALPSSHRLTQAGASSIGLTVWGIGATVLGLRLWIGQRRLQRLRASAVPAEPDVEALCLKIADRMNVEPPTVWRSPYLFSPCLDGLRRPAILLPDDVVENLIDILVHEIAHLARWDGLWNLLRRSAAVVLWVQPLLWILSRRLEAAAEDVCDDYVVQFGADRTRYAGHLLELAGRALPPVAPAGVGMVSLRSMLARRIVRILDTSRSLSTRAGTRAVFAMLAAGLVGTVLAGLLGVGGGPRKAEAQSPAKAAETKSQPEDTTFRGQVVGPDGKPVPAAKVIASHSVRVLNGIGDDYTMNRQHESVRKTADADGRYELAFEATAPEANVEVLATAPGFGLGYYLKDKPIRLSAGDLPINGRLVDLEGRPVPGVKVRLGQVWVPALESNREAGIPVTPDSMAGKLGLDAEPLLPDGVVTDADGRFRIEGLGRDVLASLTISGPTVALKKVKVLTRSMDRVADTPRGAGFVGLDEPTTHGADCTITVEPTRPIEGVVRDTETNDPIVGAVVTAATLSGSGLMLDGLIATETDAQGRYRLVGLPKEGSEGHKLAVYPPFDRPYFITRSLEAPARPGYDPVRFDIALKRGIWITGKVTDVITGKPVAAAVDYFPFLSNERARNYPNFDPNVTNSIAIKTRYKADRDGRFRITGLPGGGVVTAHTDDRSYRVGVGSESIKERTKLQTIDQLLTYDRIFPSLYQGLKEVDVPEGADSFTCDLGLDPGGSVRLRLVDTSGARVTHVVIRGRFPAAADRDDHGLYDESVARVGGLVPGTTRTVLIQHHDRKIGTVFTIPADGPRNDAEITVTLRPTATVTGRLVDAKGKPASGRIRVILIPAAASLFPRILVSSAELDAEGRFRCDNVPAGGPYQVNANDGHVYGTKRMEPSAFKLFNLARDLTLEPGQTVDIGTFDVNTAKRLEDAPAAKADVPITGRIVDLEGRPVAGVSVKAGAMLIAKSDDLAPWLESVEKGEPPWVAVRHAVSHRNAPETATREATTDNDGRFRLDGFGAERVISLNLQGGTIACTTIQIATRKMNPILAPGFPDVHGPGNRTIYGADFTYTAVPSRPIEGVVKDAKTGQPLVDTEVRSYRFAGSDFVGTMTLKTKTDAQGRFRVAGLPKGKGNELIVVPNDEQPYLLQEVTLPDPPGAGAVKIEVAMHRGIWIEGKVTEQATGKPVAEAWLHYMPFLGNTFAQAVPEFDKDGNVDGTGFQDRYQTKADGTFRLVGLPGRAIVGALVHDKQYLQGAGSESIEGLNKFGHFETFRNPINPGKLWPNVMKEINPPEDVDVVQLDLQLTTGPSVRLRVVDTGGNAISGVKTRGRTGRGVYDREDMKTDTGAVTNLMPDEVRIVLLLHEGAKLGRAVQVRKGDDANGPVVVQLEPLATMTGRAVDADGNAVPMGRVRPDVLPSGDFSLSLPEVSTDEDGRFHISDVPTGCDYAVMIETLPAIKKRRFAYLGKATVKPGETTDVGEIRFKRD